MPSHVSTDMDWVEDVVLLSKSVMDEDLLGAFRKTHVVCSEVLEESKHELVAPNLEERVCYYNLCFLEEMNFIYMYECLLFKLGVRVPFTHFEQNMLYEYRVAPTQLYPNSWGFMKAFQSVCWYLMQLDLSLRRVVGHFFENERGEYLFHLYWYSRLESSKYNLEHLDDGDKEIVKVVRKSLLQLPLIKSPPPCSEQSLPTNRAEFQAPPTPSNQAGLASDKVPSRKRKGVGHSYGLVYLPDFDAVSFIDEFIMENSRIAMDEAGLKINLEFIMKAGDEEVFDNNFMLKRIPSSMLSPHNC
ncbi:hypothetical protein PIB30_036918 [Stylosanthes scabra]|uniref:Uncharacterized protein n=1 Tax=Stylosanthes scabra TaxID=79078 RepID=A0ABU6RE89_9FABA|nr:hypothetical protein [Stylosanthes scabra]